MMTVQRALSLLAVTQPTAQSLIRLLEEQGLLREITGRSGQRMYLAEAVMHVMVPEGAIDAVQPRVMRPIGRVRLQQFCKSFGG
jgi:hypothetical protein